MSHICRCWDDTDNMNIWWIIKGPITVSLFVSYDVIACHILRLIKFNHIYQQKFIRKLT